MGILYRHISTWWTKQLVNSIRRYVSVKPVRRLLSQELAEVTIFQSRAIVSRAFLSKVLCGSSPGSCYYLPCPCSPQTLEFLNIYLLDLDGLQTRCTTSVPSYLLYFLFKQVKLAPDGICGVHKTWNFGYIQAPQSESAQHKWSSWMSNRKLLPYLSPAKSAPCSSSLSFWRYGQFCVADLETFCVWSIFRIFEHGEDKSEIHRKNYYGNITTSSLIYVIEDSWSLDV